jgi:hypothetical protein
MHLKITGLPECKKMRSSQKQILQACHSHESGNPFYLRFSDSRFHGNDTRTATIETAPSKSTIHLIASTLILRSRLTLRFSC